MLYPYQRDELEQLPSPQPARWQAANLCSCTAAQPHKNNNGSEWNIFHKQTNRKH